MFTSNGKYSERKEMTELLYEFIKNAIVNRLNLSISLLAKHKKKNFLWHIVTGDKKSIYFDNPQRKKS